MVIPQVSGARVRRTASWVISSQVLGACSGSPAFFSRLRLKKRPEASTQKGIW